MDISLFGTLQVGHDVPPSTNSRRLLAYLLLHPNQQHGRSHLAYLLNPDAPEERARRTLSQALWEARRLLPEASITTAVDTITLHDTHLHIDLHQFDTLTAALAHRDALDPPSASVAQQALALYTADLLADQYDDWLIAPRELRRERYLHTLEQLAQWEKQNQRLTAALTHMLTLTQLDPLREAAHRELMRLYIALERPQDARQQFELCRHILQEELGLPPEPETRQLAATLQERHAAQPLLAPPYVPLPTPLPAYALEDSTHMPLIGRTAERRRLLTHIAATASQNCGGLIFVSGAPGVGKSRLLQELAQDAAWRGLATAWGHGKELTAVLPYGPLCDALTSQLTPLRVTQLRALLAPTWLRWASTLLPHLADGNPLPDTSGTDGQMRLLESLVQVVLALGELKPLLMVLEDVHWADKATFDTLHRLGARLGQAPILVMLSFREAEARQNTAVWQGLTQLDTLGLRERLHLTPLTPHDTSEFVQRGLGLTQTAPLFAQRLHRETQGSPLLLLETLRALYEEGVLYRDEAGTWHTPYDVDTAAYEELTTTIESTQLIQRRLQQLSPASRHLLELAAVMGREANFAWLNAASPHPTRATLTHLNQLVERQFLLETAEAYQFSHDKVRQAVYNALPAHTQRALHGRVASVIVAQDPTAVDMLAHHFYQAQLWQEAAHYTQRAAQRATHLYANEIALALYDRLLAVLAAHEPLPPPEALTMQFEALLAQALLHGRVGQIEPQEQTLHQLQTLRPHLSPAQTVRLLNEQAHFWNSARNDYRRALELAQEARHQAEATPLPHEIITALMTLADTHTHLGHPEQAYPLYEQAWQRAHALPHNETQAAFALRGLIRTCIELGQRDELDPLLTQLIATAEASDDPFLRGMAYGERGAANYDIGRYQEVIADFEQALTYYRQAGLLHKEAVILSNLGLAYWTLLDYRQAHQVMLAGLKTYELLENKRGILYAHNNLAELYLQVGQWEAAARSLAIGLPLAEALDSADTAVLLLKSQVTLQLVQGDTAAAEATCRQIDAVASRQNAPYPLATAVSAWGELYAQRQEWASAATAYETASNYGRQAQRWWALPPWVAGRAQALWQLGQYTLAVELVTEAVQLHETYASDDGTFVYWQAHCLTGSFTPLQKAHDRLTAQLAGLPPEWEPAFRHSPRHAQIFAAWQAHQPATQSITLPYTSAPAHGKLTASQQVEIVWTISAPSDEAIADKKQRRLHQLQRLVREAEAQDARPTLQALSEALQVSLATVKRDLHLLKQNR